MAKEKRFVNTFSQGGFAENRMEVWVDRQTGVNYLYCGAGYGGGLTVLTNRDGSPVITPLPRSES